jgi:cytosine/adenosine deaminase-related metal-dependent hydrolase
MRGFFNAHCHLELGFLRGRIPPGLPFAEWLREVVRHKRTARSEDSAAAVAAGLYELRESGTQALLDIDSLGTAPGPLRAVELPAISFTEMIALDPARAGSALDYARKRQEFEGPLAAGQAFGLSPHAPYTTTPELIRAAVAVARETNQFLCVHAAETPEETELLVHGTGPLHAFLHDMKALPDNWQPPAMRPIALLHACGALGPRTLLAHVNDVTDDEVLLLAETRTRVVVCPGTHVYFRRGPFPLERLLAAGVPVYLGTDSLASNEALNMAREVELAAELSPGLAPGVVANLADARRARDFGLPV